MLTAQQYTLNPGTIIQERYQIVRALGGGGFAITYQAYDMMLRADVALKEYFPQSYAERSARDMQQVICREGENRRRFDEGLLRFKQEAARSAALKGRHNIIDVYGYCEQNGTAYMVMEYLSGQTLLAYLQTLPNGQMHDMEDAARIFHAVTEALSEVHQHQMLHRDVSPDNIFLLDDGSVRLFDFGAARDNAQDREQTVVVKSGCTPPEQYRRNGRQGPWTDLYALGATLYRMLTGSYPLPAPDRMRAGAQALTPPAQINPDVPEYLNVLALRCLMTEAHLRPRNAGEIMQVLSTRNPPKGPAKAAADYRKKRGLFFAAAALAMVLLFALSLMMLVQSKPLYDITLSPCTIIVQLPREAAPPQRALAALQEDFAALYPMVQVTFSADPAAQPAIFPTPESRTGCVPLTELRRLQPGDPYAQTIAYDAQLTYLNLQKAAQRNITRSVLLSAPIPSQYVTTNEAVFTDAQSEAYAYRAGVQSYRRVQQAMGGLYALHDTVEGFSALSLSVSSRLTQAQTLAAKRFLLYLSGESAQRLLFIEQDGLIPAEAAAQAVYFETFPELAQLLAEPLADFMNEDQRIN